MTAPRGHRAYAAASGILILFGVVHLLAVYHSNFVPPVDERAAELKRLAMAYTQPMGPFNPSTWGDIQILNSSYSVLLIYVGILNLLALRPAAHAGRLKALTVCNIFFVALLLLITMIFEFPPPMLFAGIALILFGVSGAKQRPAMR